LLDGLASHFVDQTARNRTADQAAEYQTDDELAAYRIVKAIACAEIPAERITYRDVRSYFSVLADDNNRRPIVRCYFGRRKVIAFVGDDKTEDRYEIEKLEDLYRYTEQIRQAARRWA